MSRVNGRTSDLPLRLIIFAEHTDDNLGVVREMRRDGVRIFQRSTLITGEPGSEFTGEIRRKDRVRENLRSKGRALLFVQSMNVEERDGEDPHEQPWQEQHTGEGTFLNKSNHAILRNGDDPETL
ncbi:MAG: hypothetical protein E6K63_14995 [Nitrospirae bacterium]|nr:MAG: hypothetical protein E6K63_14995 [Nitrospirota bacterium]